MKIKRNVVISVKTKKQNGNKVETDLQIRVRVTFNGNRVDIGTGYRIALAKWDADRQRVKNGCTNSLKQSSSEINTTLSKFEAAIDDVFVFFESKNTIPDVSQFKEALFDKIKVGHSSNENENQTALKEKPTTTFWDVYDLFVKESGRMNDWTKSTYEKFAAAKNHLRNFDKDLTFELLDEYRLNDYVIFLRNVKGLRNSTISKQIGFLKWFLRWAVHKGYSSNRAYEIFKPKLKYPRKVVVFLTEDEITTLSEFKIPESKQYLERVRDVFLFCCYTGIRYSDAYNLKRSDVKDQYFEIVTIKTLDKLIIKYNKYSKAILDKYKDVVFEGNKALPVISNQKMNDYIKELCELAGFNELITLTHFKGNERIEETAPKYSLIGTHTGRRSFICNALALGIPVQVVMSWTGHSDYKAMKPYIDITESVSNKCMDKFSSFGSKIYGNL